MEEKWKPSAWSSLLLIILWEKKGQCIFRVLLLLLGSRGPYEAEVFWQLGNLGLHLGWPLPLYNLGQGTSSESVFLTHQRGVIFYKIIYVNTLHKGTCVILMQRYLLDPVYFWGGSLLLCPCFMLILQALAKQEFVSWRLVWECWQGYCQFLRSRHGWGHCVHWCVLKNCHRAWHPGST